ncbi:MAG: TIGR00730 family Rossman fold protein [Actinomycetota bacterium]
MPSAADLEALITAMPRERDRDLAASLLGSLVSLLEQRPETIDLKIVTAALAEMGAAFEMFRPYRAVPKVTIFGSARTQPDDPLFQQARRAAAAMAERGWMVITGAGPGIMQAAMEGAGRARSMGVSIELPREQRPNPVIAGDSKNVTMKYFFTRKLMLVKESKAFICLPGGFGTLDEVFEVLTLTQTGKGVPVPIVFLDTPGDPYWETVHEFVDQQLVARGLVSVPDTGLYSITESSDAAVDEILRFYANFDSIRYIGELLVVRVQHAPTEAQLEVLNERFGHLCRVGHIERVAPHEREIAEHDAADLPRIGLRFTRHGYGDLRAMIDLLNSFVPDPVAPED